MLRIIEGGFRSMAKERLNREILLSVKAGRRSVLIVPEQKTLTEESEMSRLLPESAPLCFEVTNFSRFTNTVFRRIGGISGRYSTKSERSLLMWRALTELGPTLTLTGNSREVSIGTVERAMAAVGEMENLGLTPEELLASLKRAEGTDKRLISKISDLGSLWATYKKLLGERYADAAEDTVKLCEELRAGRDPEIDEVFVEGFTSFTEPQYSLLCELMRRLPVTVLITLPKVGRDGFEWAELKGTHARLSSIASSLGQRKEIIKPDTAQSDRDLIRAIASLLWCRDDKIDNSYLQNEDDVRGRVRIFEAATPFEECDFVASDIKRRVMGGARFSDFAIVARRAENLVGILDVSLKKAKIPHFISKARDLSGFEAVKLIYSAYATVSRGFRSEDVMTYLKCGLTGISRHARDEFESYVRVWGIDGKRFSDGVAWNMNPRGYQELSDRDRRQLVRINETRNKLIAPLLMLEEDTKAATTVLDHATALVKFLKDINLEDSLIKRAYTLNRVGETEAAEENTRLWGLICRALDILVDLSKDTPASAESFINQLSLVINEETVGRIPAHVDEVTIGSADMLRVEGKRHVYLLGVNSGEFPATVSDNSYFTERDKLRLTAMGLDLKPDLEIRCARELYSFSRAFTSAGDSVTLLYSSQSATGAPLKPADPIARITALTDGIVKVNRIAALSPKDRLYTPEGALEFIADAEPKIAKSITEALKKCGRADDLKLMNSIITNPSFSLSGEVVKLLFGSDMYLSQSKIESYLGCPMGYFFKYVLCLNAEERADFGSNVVGSFVHGLLEDIFRSSVDNSQDLTTLTQDEIGELCRLAAEKYTKKVFGEAADNARTRVKVKRLTEATVPVLCGLIDELRGSSFMSVCFELSTSSSDPSLPNPVVYKTEDGRRIVIGGLVDRVDKYTHNGCTYVRVLDYKTGSKSFDPSDIEKGYNLQMFLYLKAIVESDSPEFLKRIGAEEGDELVPAGVLYVKTSIKDAGVDSYDDMSAEDAVRKLQTRDGMLLEDEISLGAMNPAYLPEVSKKSNSDTDTRRYDRARWQEINDTMESAILNIAKDMSSGTVLACPDKDQHPCDYCGYKHICRSALPPKKW